VILQAGAGWGALEMRRRAQDPAAAPIPSSFLFPEATLGPEQEPWLGLLKGGRLEAQEPAAAPEPATAPGGWMIQAEWQELLERSLAKDGGRNWYALLHLGVMRLERFDEAGAAAAWQESLRLRPSAWAYRNLAILAHRQSRDADVPALYEQAWALAGEASLDLAVEYLQVLNEIRAYETARAVYESLPENLRDLDRIQILRGRFALELGDLEAVEQVLEREYAVIREGDMELTNQWSELWARRLAAQTGRAMDEALRAEAQKKYPPPSRIDFRFINQ
jgi:hypothetical protein